MFTSTAEVFRTRQAVRDLAEAVGLHREAVLRLGVSGADRDIISNIISGGCRIGAKNHRDLYPNILLAAAMPDEDFNSFIGATALLLADLLQNGEGADDLYWNWEAFCDHYRLADPPVRAAIMNGFRLANDLGIANLALQPMIADCLTFDENDVIAMLRSVGENDLCLAVRTGVSPQEAGKLWQDAKLDRQSWDTLAGFRYLYEREGSLEPPKGEDSALIPWL